MATLQIRKKGVKSWWHYPSDRQPYFLSRLTCVMFGEYLVIREIRDTTKTNGAEVTRYHYTDITVFDDTSGGSPETFPNPIALTNRLAQLEYVGFEQGGGGIGFQPNISNPQDGQTILYNEDTGAWENHYIDSQGDRFLTLGTVEVDGNEITLKPTFSWTIQQSEHSYDVDWVNVVPYTSEAGKFRTDIIVATNAGIFIRIQGVEGDVAVSPTVPENTLLVTPIDVFHDSLGDVEPPIVGEQYVKKMGYNNLYLTGAGTTAPVLSENKRNEVILSYTGSNIIDGFKDGMPGQPSTLYQGMIVTIDNQTAEEVPLNDMTNSTHPNSDIKMDFRAGISQYIMKPGELLTFKLRGSVLVFVSTNKAEVDVEVPTKTSDLINDGADDTSTYVEFDELAPVATSNDYEDLDNLPSLDFVPTSDVGVANGVAPTGSDNKIPLSFFPDAILGQVVFGGTVVPTTGVATLSTNAKTKLGTTDATITLTNDTTPITGYEANEGIYYIAFDDGTFAGITLTVGDWLISTGSGWSKIDNTDAVTMVNGETGAVTTPLDKVLGQGNTATDKSIELNSATPDSPKVTINNEEVKVENATEGVSTRLDIQKVVFKQGVNELNIQPEAVDDDYNVTIQAKNHTVAGMDDILSDAVDIDYDNTTSGLDAENVQEMGDELSAKKEDRVSVIPITTNTTISALHHGKILLITADVTITFPTGLGADFTGCAFRITTGGKMTPAFASGVTGGSFFADYNPGESLYVFKESDSTNVFYAV